MPRSLSLPDPTAIFPWTPAATAVSEPPFPELLQPSLTLRCETPRARSHRHPPCPSRLQLRRPPPVLEHLLLFCYIKKWGEDAYPGYSAFLGTSSSLGSVCVPASTSCLPQCRQLPPACTSAYLVTISWPSSTYPVGRVRIPAIAEPPGGGAQCLGVLSQLRRTRVRKLPRHILVTGGGGGGAVLFHLHGLATCEIGE